MTATSMRPTAVLWAGALPNHWEERRARFMFDRLRLPPGDDQGVVTAFRDGQVTLRENRRSDGFTFATKEIGYQGVRAGNLVVHSMDGFAGAIGVSESTGKCSPVCVVCDPKPGVDARFHAYVLRHMALSGYITSLAKGIRERSTSFGWGELKEQWLPLPTLPTQKAIAHFLDRKTAAIDALIEKKQKLLDLLAEKRAALINQAVTKGLDPNVPMKNSGVERIGSVPAHWEIVSLRRVGNVGQGDAFAHAIQGQESGRFPWFKVNDMNRPGNETEMLAADNYVDAEVASGARATIFPPGTVIFPRVGAALLTNKRRILSRHSIIDDNVYGFIPAEAVHTRFLYLSLLTVDMSSLCSPGLVPTVTFSAIKELRIALPSLPEQGRIVEQTEAQLQSLASLAASTRQSNQVLAEYRQALITAAVTGQLDIGEEAA